MARHFASLSDPELIQMIKSGAVGVLPTDTVYGLVAAATLPEAVSKLYGVKPRELAPGTIIGSSVESFVKLGFPMSQLDLVSHFWPAALSVVLDAKDVSPIVKQVRNDLPVRIPNNNRLFKLLTQTGPLMTTSANAPHQPTSTNVQMAVDYFGDDVDFYVDGGDLSGRPPSTIIGISDDGQITVYRHGAVAIS